MADNMGVNPFIRGSIDPEIILRTLVWAAVIHKGDVSEDDFDTDDIKLVWFSKTLGNWKGLATTSLADGKYYEVTHNKEKNETYVDVYLKINHRVFPGLDMDDSDG